MKLRADSKHKFNTAKMLPGQVMRGTVKTAALQKMALNNNLSGALKTLSPELKKK